MCAHLKLLLLHGLRDGHVLRELAAAPHAQAQRGQREAEPKKPDRKSNEVDDGHCTRSGALDLLWVCS